MVKKGTTITLKNRLTALIIPQKSEIYLRRAWTQFLEVEAEYDKWHSDIYLKRLDKCTYSLKDHYRRFPDVPELTVIIPKDDAAGQVAQEIDEELTKLGEFNLNKHAIGGDIDSNKIDSSKNSSSLEEEMRISESKSRNK